MKIHLNNPFMGSLGLILALGLLVNCQRARMESQLPVEQKTMPLGHLQSPSPQNENAGICTPSLVTDNKNVKILFVIDTSGSNVGEAGTVPSDPGKKWRAQTLRSFLSKYLEKENFHYGFGIFSGTSAKSQIQVDGEPGFSNQRAVVIRGFRSFMKTPDTGNTPYRAALKLAKKIIADDLQENASEQASYSVVFISDGQATDYKSAHDVIPDAAAIKDLAPDRITLNSVYYSKKKINPSAPQYLKSIAEIGEGSYTLASSRQPLKLEEKIRLAPGTCH